MRLPSLLLLLTFAAGPAQAAGECASLQACLTQLRALATRPEHRAEQMQSPEADLLARVRSFDEGIPALVALLADADKRVAVMGAKGLRDAEAIDPVYLPQVKAGLDRELKWLAPALGHMDSDAAAREAVARLLVSKSAPHNQEAYAVQLSGKRAIPFIIEAARCANGCGPNDHYYLGYVLSEMGEVRALAAPGLMALAADPSVLPEVAAGALQMIGRLQSDGASLETQLIALRQRAPLLAPAVDEALVGTGSSAAGTIFTARLREQADLYVLRDLAETGRAGRPAGPLLVELLGHEDWDVRLGAARALGFIGYEPSAEALAALLDDSEDVRINWSAAESLGRLHAASAEPALQRAAQAHWFPPVRQAAAKALAAIRDGTPYAADDDTFMPEFFKYQHIANDVPACSVPALARVDESPQQKLRAPEAGERLAKLSFAATILSYGAAEDRDGTAKPGELIAVTKDNMVEHRQTVLQEPNVALRVEGGWLAGSNRGEWGGELIFLDDRGVRQTLLEKNVEDIYKLGSRLVAVTGLGHLFMQEGMLYELVRDAAGRWSAHPWRALPGAPDESWLVEGGELQVSVGDASLLVDANGTMRMAPCLQ
ncbi:HEAT repeat domain-containing protein [Agrilutibacter solisilvae]|uniref:HEAT repeat domain-containing protein n=1 Tax=Agrilutibacter solisilvae TaxID=2763317 RepID=A0A975AT52_9GAMM|nr:HEAT repeat domain-containing protein [Lysobacter solisilvae]QSX78938.1 HEAT repeat domain-containing protein [Lysobacter solisilvae]